MSSAFSRGDTRAPRVQFNVGLHPDLKKRIEALAERRGCFVARVVAEALEDYLAINEKRGER